MNYQPLFDYLNKEHNLILTESEMDDLIRVVRQLFEPVTHELKILPKYLDAVKTMVKPFEVRKNDRDFKVGDQVCLREWIPKPEDYPHELYSGYTGNVVYRNISYVLQGGQYGIDPEYVVLGLQRP